MNILAVESSCDETAVAIVRDGREVLCDCIASQVDLHRIYGGVVPEIASRKHIEAIYGLADQALEKTGLSRETIGEELEKRRDVVEEKLEHVDPGALRKLKEYRKTHGEALRIRNREAYQQMIRRRLEHLKRLEQEHPELAEKLRQLLESGKNGNGSP